MGPQTMKGGHLGDQNQREKCDVQGGECYYLPHLALNKKKKIFCENFSIGDVFICFKTQVGKPFLLLLLI